jgi:hypothetical protein
VKILKKAALFLILFIHDKSFRKFFLEEYGLNRSLKAKAK